MANFLMMTAFVHINLVLSTLFIITLKDKQIKLGTYYIKNYEMFKDSKNTYVVETIYRYF